MANLTNSYFSHPYVHLLNIPVLVVNLLIARGVVLVAGFAEIMPVLLLVVLQYHFSATADSEQWIKKGAQAIGRNVFYCVFN